MDPLIGQTLGRYRILDELGRGGMGVVYRAVDTRLNREVAIKILPPALVADPERKERFLREAQTASALEHPHIGVIHEVDEAAGITFMAMELIRGEKLSTLIARGELPSVRALDLATEVAEGLALAHERGVVHRDLKPANVMVTEHGHVKIIDFGLAKLVRALSGDADETMPAGTAPGIVMGTTSYMSPEQARGSRVDQRSDIFSFGVLLYEMLAGRLPFAGRSGIEVASAILHEPAAPLPPLGQAVPPDAALAMQRIIDKCLEKEPSARYQGMRDVVVDLRAARRQLDSGRTTAVSIPATQAARRAHPMRLMAIAAVALLVAGVGGLVVWSRLHPTSAPLAELSGKPSVAVLYFQNNTGSTQLDWLRAGLTDMMVTDLSQSPDVEVLSTDRLYTILKDLNRQNDQVVSADTIQQIARRAGVKTVLLGNYMKAGETIRINITLQEAASGRIVSADRVDAAGESTLFSTVDELTRRVKTTFARPATTAATRGLLTPPAPSETSGIFRSLSEVTTNSTDAYRFYAQAIDLHQRGQDAEAIPLFERAIAIDPGFALAMTKLAVVQHNTGRWDLSDQYAKRALDHSDRLSPRERYYIEGYYYSAHDETLAKGLEAYKRAVDLYPDHFSAMHNLADLYLDLERVDEAIPLNEAILRRDVTSTLTYSNLARDYASLGQFDKGREVMETLFRVEPASAPGHRFLAEILIAGGKLDDALVALSKADALDGRLADSVPRRWYVAILQNTRAEAENLAQQLMQSADSFKRWQGIRFHEVNELSLGRDVSAVSDLLASLSPRGSDLTVRARGEAAEVLLRLGKPALALGQAHRALADARTIDAGWDSAYYAILALSRLGRDAEAANALEALRAKANAFPSNREKRGIHWLAGVMALDHHQVAVAIEELRQAESMLLPHGMIPPPPPHARIWFDLGSAYLAAGDDTNAAARFQRIVDSTERILVPVPFVRSLYFLGQIADRRGDREKARAYYERFVSYWRDGETDRDRVADARQKLSALAK